MSTKRLFDNQVGTSVEEAKRAKLTLSDEVGKCFDKLEKLSDEEACERIQFALRTYARNGFSRLLECSAEFLKLKLSPLVHDKLWSVVKKCLASVDIDKSEFIQLAKSSINSGSLKFD